MSKSTGFVGKCSLCRQSRQLYCDHGISGDFCSACYDFLFMRLSSIGAHDIIERLQDAQRLAALVLIFMDASFDATVPEMFDEFRRLAEKLAPQQAEQAQDDTGGG